MATSFFGGNFFGGEFFSVSTTSDVVKTGTGGIDPGDAKRRSIVKPTGLLRLPKKVKEGRKEVSDRIDDSRLIQAEVAARLAREFGEEIAREPEPIVEMSLREIEAEIGVLLRKKLRTEEDEAILLLLLAAAAA